MTSYPIFPNEKERLQELFSYEILDSPVETEFEDLVQIAAKMFNVPVAAITFVDASRQWIKARRGVDFCELDRKTSICNYTISQKSIFAVTDLQSDERFCQFPYVAGAPFYRYYAGVPLITANGYSIGVFCIIDTVVRKLDEAERQLLIAMARQSMRQVELRLRNLQLENLNEKQRIISSRLSHDIKKPLSNIKMMLHMQSGEENYIEQDELTGMNGVLERQVDGTIDMLDNMIKWGKLQLQNNRGAVQNTNLRQLAGEAIDEIKIDSSTKQNVLVNAIPANVNAHVDCEGIRFALRNLLTNANKFTAGGCITISHEYNNGKDFIHVTDTGVGMTEEQIVNLNTNKSADFTYGTSNEKGNGLGLGLVHDYLAEHNSQLQFQSKLGKGTRVSFSL